MTDQEKRAAARQFAADWQDRGDEKQETQAFWLALLPISAAGAALTRPRRRQKRRNN